MGLFFKFKLWDTLVGLGEFGRAVVTKQYNLEHTYHVTGHPGELVAPSIAAVNNKLMLDYESHVCVSTF